MLHRQDSLEAQSGQTKTLALEDTFYSLGHLHSFSYTLSEMRCLQLAALNPTHRTVLWGTFSGTRSAFAAWPQSNKLLLYWEHELFTLCQCFHNTFFFFFFFNMTVHSIQWLQPVCQLRALTHTHLQQPFTLLTAQCLGLSHGNVLWQWGEMCLLCNQKDTC